MGDSSENKNKSTQSLTPGSNGSAGGAWLPPSPSHNELQRLQQHKNTMPMCTASVAIFPQNNSSQDVRRYGRGRRESVDLNSEEMRAKGWEIRDQCGSPPRMVTPHGPDELNHPMPLGEIKKQLNRISSSPLLEEALPEANQNKIKKLIQTCRNFDDQVRKYKRKYNLLQIYFGGKILYFNVDDAY